MLKNGQQVVSRWMLMLALVVAPKLWAATETLQSASLQLEITTGPYSFRVLERSTGAALLVHSRTAFNEVPVWVTAAADISKSGNSLSATLMLAGGGKAQISFTFTQPEILQVKINAADASVGEVFEEFKDQGEHYYGIWEYPFGGNIDNRGADDDFLGLRRLPDVNYSSARAPFYMTSGRYAIYVESTARGHYAIARESHSSFVFTGNSLTYDIIYGPTYADMLKRYNGLGDASIMPPTWAFDSIWWRDDHHNDLRDVTNAQGKVIDDADRLRKLRIPASAIWLDRPFGTGEMGWGNFDFDASFPSPPKMVRDLADRGMFLLVWVANRISNSAYEEGAARGYMFDGPWSAADLRRPEVYDWFKKKLDAFVHLGIKGYKIDRGEENELPRSTENLHAILLPKLAAEGMAATNGPDFFNFSRNANDTARKYTSIWNGDTRATFGGLAVSVKNGLRCGAINFPMWGSDTGAYIGQPTKELFARWLEFSAYSPMMEVLIGPRRTIWYDYDDELVDIARRYATSHHDLIPYTRSAMYQATQSGMPVMRSLIFAYPTDAKLYDMWDEYLFGEAILAAPVTVADVRTRNVYLPAGQWLDYNDRKTAFQGGATIPASAPLGTIPLFVREGAIIPRGDIVKTNNNWEQNWAPKLRIEVFPSETTASRFDYYTGSAVRTIGVAPKSGGLEITFDDLGAPGSVEIYWNGATRVLRNGHQLKGGADYSYDDAAHRLVVPFTGATKLTIEGGRSLFSVVATP